MVSLSNYINTVFGSMKLKVGDKVKDIDGDIWTIIAVLDNKKHEYNCVCEHKLRVDQWINDSFKESDLTLLIDKPKKVHYKKGAEYLTSEAIPDSIRNIIIIITEKYYGTTGYYSPSESKWRIISLNKDLTFNDWVECEIPKKWKEL